MHITCRMHQGVKGKAKSWHWLTCWATSVSLILKYEPERAQQAPEDLLCHPSKPEESLQGEQMPQSCRCDHLCRHPCTVPSAATAPGRHKQLQLWKSTNSRQESLSDIGNKNSLFQQPLSFSVRGCRCAFMAQGGCQLTFEAPRKSLRTCSIWALLRVGFRFSFNRHSSVVSTVLQGGSKP
jgi:hypothetical protein